MYYTSSRFRITSTTPLREIAYQNRLGLNTQCNPSDFEMGLAVMREQTRRGQATHICEPLERSYFVTNWCLAWKGLEDIIPTAMKAEDNNEKEKHPPTTGVKPKMMVLGHSMPRDTPSRCKSHPSPPFPFP
jgi:hypothetical protein